MRQRPADRIRKLESELRETKAVNQQSKQIWMATMKDDINTVEKLRLEVERIAQEKQDMQRQFEAKLTEMAQDRETARQTRPCKKRQNLRNPRTDTATVLINSDKRWREWRKKIRYSDSSRR